MGLNAAARAAGYTRGYGDLEDEAGREQFQCSPDEVGALFDKACTRRAAITPRYEGQHDTASYLDEPTSCVYPKERARPRRVGDARGVSPQII